ncbi:CBS domain-containing protein [Tunturiibacter empetritectus]|uniref:Flagellar motility protein MotE (MotC chaperone)/sporulation protein YlmC with PRC-barrel domain n=1 Tax=Tunturiibacter lichenicola TaxID=2051959 RepID=A0A852VG83_9BACT|nr:CBS domain-containing protein [Edaphobacter lichenicola]NYF89454.1 flagellar motility protein MotE (MotC chaperone)/sporulation protein YlmC with PRC-barrel domain [Edaphobacter lichenicola]
MTRHANQRTSVSALMGSAVADAQGATLGHVRELAVAPSVDAAHIHGVVLKLASSKRTDKPSLVLISQLELSPDGTMQLRESAQPTPLPEDESFLLLERDLLDQQIIDVHGHKVVRVNDVDLVWENCQEDLPDLSLRIAEVEVGMRGAVRRLLKGLPSTSVDRISSRFGASVIPWDFVDLIDRDPARRVRLKIEQDRLSKMHPSDIADILEELAPAERHALFVSLDEEVAAEALEEVKPKMQQALIESLDSEQIAGIVEEMDPGAAADLLSELTDERSEAILEEMDPEERQEVEDLLEFAGNSAAGRMTTEYIALPSAALVDHAIGALRDYEGDIDMITDIYLLDEDEKIIALVPLVQLLLAAPGTPLTNMPHSHLVTCNVDANGRKVAELFDKYNLRSLPVVDNEKHLTGVIHAEQVIALLRASR